MKARFVHESVNFERGKEPKESMGVGMWMELKIQEMMERMVETYGGSYTITREGSTIEGFYSNDLFSSKGRSIIYNIKNKTFSFSFPGMGTMMEIKDLAWWEDEVDKDLSNREKEIEKLGYNPFTEDPYITENVRFERGINPKRAMGIGYKWKLQLWRKYEQYTNWTEFRLFKDDELYADGSTLQWAGPKYEEKQNMYKNYFAFLKAHGLAKKDVEIEKKGYKEY